MECVLGSLGHSVAYVKIWAGRLAAPPRGRNMVFRKTRFGWVGECLQYGVVSGPIFTTFSPNVGGTALDHMSYRFRISLSVPEIFATKLRSHLKSTQIFHIFGPQLFWREGPQNFGTMIIKCNNLSIIWQSFGRRSSEISWRNKKGKKNSSKT